MNEILKGTSNREANDFYATNPKCVVDVLERLNLESDLKVLEPCAGNGHMAKILKNNFADVKTNDLIQRDYPLDSVGDFLNDYIIDDVDVVITNPPFKYAKQFIEKSLNEINDDGKVIMFARLQLLEGKSRKELNIKHLEKVFVYTYRVNTAKNGDEREFLKSSSMCFAWFVYSNNKNSETIIEFI